MTTTLTEIPARTLDVMRRAWLPLLSTDQIELLRAACEAQTEELIQGHTTQPEPCDLSEIRCECVGACLIAFPLWKTLGLHDVDAVECAFATHCDLMNKRYHQLVPEETHANRHIMNWYDATPLSQSLPLMVAELTRELEERKAC